MPRSLENITVAIAEHRYTGQLTQLLERQGAVVFACPLVKETPTEDTEGAQRFKELCATTAVDYIVFFTGVGVDFLFRAAAEPEVIGRSKILARGPKAVNALRRAGVRIDLVADAPTTDGIIATLSREDLKGKSVLVQLYGRENPELTTALEARGARVTGISLYRYTEASDRAAIDGLIDKLLAGDVDSIMFTSAPQVRFLFDAAAARRLDARLQQRLQDVVVASIGEVTGRELQHIGVSAQVMPADPKMGPMVQALADYFEKRRVCSTPSSSN